MEIHFTESGRTVCSVDADVVPRTGEVIITNGRRYIVAEVTWTVHARGTSHSGVMPDVVAGSTFNRPMPPPMQVSPSMKATVVLKDSGEKDHDSLKWPGPIRT